MNIIYVSPEVVPFAKTGGLADVAGALPKCLSKLGHNVSVFMPLYKGVKNVLNPVQTNLSFEIPIPYPGTGQVHNNSNCGSIYKGFLPESKTPVYFINNEGYYGRDELYKDPKTGKDYIDNCERFIFFSRGVLEAIKLLKLTPDIIHCNDWQSALISVYLKTLYATDPCFKKVRSVFTIHNLGYQGLFWHWDMKLTGLDWSLFNWKQLEFFGYLNFLKGGIVFSDVISTVSKKYAEEIQTTDDFGKGLEGVLRERAKDLYGILNGIDYSVWDPTHDKLIPANYSINDLKGKQICKRHLQQKFNLPQKDVPTLAMITRLDVQKGVLLLADIFDELMKLDLQFVLLGTGDREYETRFKDFAKKYPKQLGVNIGFDNRLAHEIEAGADVFLMPSKYEPCGLNQLYSLRYGTVPLVRNTGGLADTITDCTPATLQNGKANGFSFDEFTSQALLKIIKRAITLYKDRATWLEVVKNGMVQDWSWERSAKEYAKLYEKALQKG
ncbi:MAG TPA: glycogen synthase GlgA [Candidatus Brocadiales bacterium]|nr:glycogen synthase GlgA [Candidatus Brocadiales bacterium]